MTKRPVTIVGSDVTGCCEKVILHSHALNASLHRAPGTKLRICDDIP